ncbi:MAG: RecX family transcriptional regulator [Paramuribaculum sp.]|nr:RecX family transcriptional regulator [Paramuribaculum sp.]
MNKKITPDKALARLQDLCVRSEQCSFDLRKKLYNWGLAADEAEKIIGSLTADNFINDERFAEAFTRDKYRFSGWGRMKIKLHLAAKHMSRATIDTAMFAIDEDEYRSVALKALKAKARTLKEGNTYEGRTKLFRFGVTRGFETGLVSELIKSGMIWE